EGAQRGRETGDLVDALPLRRECSQEGAELRRRGFSLHHAAHYGLGLVATQVPTGQDPCERVSKFHHANPRKFRIMRSPSAVRIDSGWNWTPSSGSVR